MSRKSFNFELSEERSAAHQVEESSPSPQRIRVIEDATPAGRTSRREESGERSVGGSPVDGKQGLFKDKVKGMAKIEESDESLVSSRKSQGFQKEEILEKIAHEVLSLERRLGYR